nr:ABC transporter permease [Rhodococcus pseudokoreensis]
MTTIRTTTTTAQVGRPSAVDQLAALTVRNLRTSARVPQLLMFSLTMPMAMLVLFSQVFRSVAAGPGFPAGVSYIVFLTPAMLAVSTVMAGTNAGVSAAIDHTNGLHDRFAALPMRAALPGVARTINEAAFTLARAALLGIAAVALGFEFHGTAVDAVAAVVVLVVLAGAMSALFGLIGDRLRRPDVVQFAGMMVMMPLMFVSSAFAPIETMPVDAGHGDGESGRARHRRPARARARHRHRW